MHRKVVKKLEAAFHRNSPVCSIKFKARKAGKFEKMYFLSDHMCVLYDQLAFVSRYLFEGKKIDSNCRIHGKYMVFKHGRFRAVVPATPQQTCFREAVF